MMKIFHTLLVSILVISVSGYVYPQQKRKDAIGQDANSIQSVRADFVQEKHLKILARPMISKGRLYYQAPRSLRWEYVSPIRSILLVHEGDTKRYIVRDGKIIEDSSAKMQSMHIVMDEITRWLSGRFDENPDFKIEAKTENQIVLKPVKESFSKIINRIEIFLSNKKGVIHSVIIHENEDSYTKLNFEKVVLNEKLSESLFREI